MSNIYEKCQISTFSNSGHTVVIQYPKSTNKMQLCRIIYYSLAAVCVSSDIFAHHQERQNYYSFWYYTRMSLPAGISRQRHTCVMPGTVMQF